MATFQLTATHLENEATTPQLIHVRARVADAETARSVASGFAKSTKVRATTLTLGPREQYAEVGYLTFDASLVADGTNGGTNEAGLRRYRSLLRQLTALGHDVEYVVTFANSYATLDAFEAALAAVAAR